MKKNIVSWDLETTGLDKIHDRIIQISAVKLDRETLEEIDTFDSYVIPEGNDWHITEAASEVNGMTDSMIREKGRPAREVFPEFIEFIKDSDYLTFNGNSFDVEFAYRDMAELGLQLPMEDRVFYDSKRIETMLNSNRLIHTYKRYTGKTMEEAGLSAHDSLSDSRATAEVFRHQLKKMGVSLEEMAELDENKIWSPENSIRKGNNDGREVMLFNQGKYRDRDLYDVMLSDPNYLKWWAEKVATSYSRNVARAYLLNRKKNG